VAVLVSVPEEQTACQKAVQEAGGVTAPPGRYVPQCDEDGEYKPIQFHSSSGHSWCVTREGVEIAGTRTPPGEPAPTCSPFTGTFSPAVLWDMNEADFCVCRLTYVLYLIS